MLDSDDPVFFPIASILNSCSVYRFSSVSLDGVTGFCAALLLRIDIPCDLSQLHTVVVDLTPRMFAISRAVIS